MTRWIFLVLLLLLMRLIAAAGFIGSESIGYHASMAFGFLVLAGFLAGELALKLRLPRISGYLLAGILCGPQLLGVLDQQVVDYLAPIDRLALFFIALTAGAELDAGMVRRQWKAVSGIALAQLIPGGIMVLGLIWLLASWLPVFSDLHGMSLVAAAALIAVVSTAKSPATTVAVIVETGARGPLRDMALAVTVLMDVLVIIAFSLVLGWSASHLGGSEAFSLWHELKALGMSLLLGLACGFLLVRILEKEHANLQMLILLGALLLVQLSRDLHLDALMLALSAGFVVANRSSSGPRFLHALEDVSQPVFLVFFGLAGAVLDLNLLMQIWPVALLLVGFRLLAKWSTVTISARMSGLPEQVRDRVWMSFLGQAGVSLGFATLIAAQVPGIGSQLRELIVAAVVVNQLIGPVLFKHALAKAGEIPR